MKYTILHGQIRTGSV